METQQFSNQPINNYKVVVDFRFNCLAVDLFNPFLASEK